MGYNKKLSKKGIDERVDALESDVGIIEDIGGLFFNVLQGDKGSQSPLKYKVSDFCGHFLQRIVISHHCKLLSSDLELKEFEELKGIDIYGNHDDSEVETLEA